MGSRISAPSLPQNGSEAALAEQHNSNNQPGTSRSGHNSNTHNNSNLSDTTNRINQRVNNPHGSNASNALASTLASHPNATTILMRTCNPSSGFASLLASTSGLEPTVVSSPQQMNPSNMYHFDVFAPRSYTTQYVNHQNGIKCPVCSKILVTEDIEYHLILCLTKPNRISYNEDILLSNKGECVICLEDLQEGDRIARLPCLCVYHKKCIDQWFEVNRSCPEHPSD